MKRAFTIIELVVVIVIVATIATLAVVKVGGLFDYAKRTAAETDLRTLREAFVDVDSGLLRDVGSTKGFNPLVLQLSDLFLYTNKFERWDVERGRGWRGPYVKSSSTNDPWGSAYVLQIPESDFGNGGLGENDAQRFRFARIVSAGPDRRMETPVDCFTNFNNRVSPGYDDLVIYLSDPD